MQESKITIWGALAAVFFGVIGFLAIAEIGLRMAYPHWKDFYSGRFIQSESVPGHSVIAVGRPNYEGYFAQNNGDFRILLRINEFGLRNDESVTASNDRVWIIGDSMAFGWGVNRNEMYSSIISDRTGLKTYNVASPGTDVCGYQSLAARMPTSAKPKAVVIGLILENDIRNYDCRENAKRKKGQTINMKPQPFRLITLKVYLTQYSALYNLTVASIKRVGPVIDILKSLNMINQEHAYKLLFNSSQIDSLAASVVRELSVLKSMFADGTPFSVLIAPARFEIRDDDAPYKKLRIQLVNSLTAAGIGVIDPYFEFKKAGFEATHFRYDGHWSALGHEIAGIAAAKWLSKKLANQ